ncbi:MAG: class I SAM-dependent rRNA methyltransferase [Armatimonadetes bacterium]|nr:class I SAM-dependent rRNA methyltransferase [Armatimonadota bacterium]
MPEGVVHLKKGKERKVTNGYPWIQRGECRADGVEDGSVARLVDHEGRFLARGTYNAKSRFQFRIFSLEDRPLDEAFFVERWSAAQALRERLFPGLEAWRLSHSEADGLPGLIADRYGSSVIVQVRSLGMERLREAWLPALTQVTGAEGVLERSEMAGREEEGLSPKSGLLYGAVPDDVDIVEGGLTYSVPLSSGLKTGHYLDQRETKRRFSERVEKGQKVLDCFCYTGAFSLTAAQNGALAYGIDLNGPAIERARENAARNGLEAVFVQANAFEYLESDSLGPYDWIVLDPPAIAKTAEKRDSLKWAVWKLVKNALPLLKPGGKMVVCSCSYQLGLHELLETCRLAAGDAGTRLTLEDVTVQDLDHPAPLSFPESLYLKCAWLRKSP